MGRSCDRLELLHGPDRSATTVVGVLDHHHPAEGVVLVSAAYRTLHRIGVEQSTRAVLGIDHASRECGRSAGLVVDDVTLAMGDQLLSGFTDRTDGQLVCHGAARGEEGGLLPEFVRDRRFERLDGRIVPEDVVAEFGGIHGGTHLRGGSGDGIAS